MRTFNSLIAFAQHLESVAVKEVVFIQTGLEKCAKIIQKSAEEEIGHLQPEVGPFPAWEPLAESTLADKERQGYLFNDDGNPLLRTGELKASMSYKVSPLEAIIGSTSPIMIYHEFGTIKMPMRAVVGPAAYKNKDKIKEILGLAIMGAFYSTSMTQLSEGYYKDL